MRYVITEKGPRGNAAPIAEAEDLPLACKILDLALETAEPLWIYALRDNGVVLTERAVVRPSEADREAFLSDEARFGPQD